MPTYDLRKAIKPLMMPEQADFFYSFSQPAAQFRRLSAINDF
jgi:hypothetical protein